ncbi:4Fe-4S dicluster domain-containing protein [Bordetella petrii]|uniref:4Fe-4S dicluster domain-containing protein n=1 Tax=Bordetella petrii TaxID=94624 RepID=UPI001E3DA41A|nr:4Fe-4S dicluster domain-containing protein [Bordetella petrii]MCD0501415.1 4Fe-4S dicluster domain-containing protein [Bordetella petrii]
MAFTRRQLLTGRRPRPGAMALDALRSRPWRARILAACLAGQGIECRVCGTACTANAIQFPLTRGGAARPRVDAARCNGCGQCLPGCPSSAIVPEAA